MAYFSKDFLQFFKDLAANNNKDWFDENRKRYEREVKLPFEKFVSDVISRVSKIDSNIKVSPKDCIFRINRDIRFSNDKTPYKLQMSAIVTAGGKKDKVSPGMYIELTPEHARVYGGVYMPEKDQLNSIRSYIAGHMKEFESAINGTEFKAKYGMIRGETNKVIPSEFKAAGEKQPLIYNKQFYYFGEIRPEGILKDNFLDEVMSYYSAAAEVRNFLGKALKA